MTTEGTWHEVASGQVLFFSGACGVPGSLRRGMIDAQGVHTSFKKVQAIQQAQPPRNI